MAAPAVLFGALEAVDVQHRWPFWSHEAAAPAPADHFVLGAHHEGKRVGCLDEGPRPVGPRRTLTIVTDNWGNADTVKRKHDRIGLGGFFEVFAVSSELGLQQPRRPQYHAARDALGLQPAECFYVDDDPTLVAARAGRCVVLPLL